jgi:mycothiol synthase
MSNLHRPRIRNYQPGDEADWLALLNAAPDSAYQFFNQSPSLNVLRMVVEHPHMDATRNLFFAELSTHSEASPASARRIVASVQPARRFAASPQQARRFAGYAEVWGAEGKPRAVGRLLVHPRWGRQKLGSRLLRRIEGRALEIGCQYLDVALAAEREGSRCFLEVQGFGVVHYRWHMVMPDLDLALAPRWPDGYQTRNFRPGLDERTSAQLENACFAEAWEYVPVEVGEFEGFVRSPSFRADGVIYATHEGRVVGECWCWLQIAENRAPGAKRRGDVWSLCVLPAHRRRGLGRALLLAGVQWLRHQGATTAYLGVDGANEEAKQLYQSAGFVTQRTDVWYRKGLKRQMEPRI